MKKVAVKQKNTNEINKKYNINNIMKKLFLFSFFPLLATFIVPLTSCAQATYYFMPLAIYGQSIFDPTTLSDHYDLNKYNSSSFKQTSPDKALFNMSDLSVNKFIVDENDGSS
jgi:hypothetical protein